LPEVIPGDVNALAADVIAAAPSLDPDRVEAACRKLIDGMRTGSTPLADATARTVLGSLREHRCFRPMQRVADAMIRFGCDGPSVWRQYAQALIDCGQLVPAAELLRGLIARPGTGSGEQAETFGLLGRVHKEIYIQAAGCQLGLGATALTSALDAYRRGLALDCGRHLIWHGTNLVALLRRAERDGAMPGAGDTVRSLAERIIAAVTAKPGPQAWDYAAATEAALSLPDLAAAEHWIGRYIAAPDADAFALAGTLRQLTALWGLQPGTTGAGQLVTVLHAALLQKSGGRLELQPGDMPGLAAAGHGAFERILGDTGVQTYTWLQTGLERALAVAMVRQGDGRCIGTGFLVRGGDLDPRLGDERLLLTNAHVVSDDPADQGAPSDTVSVTFEARDAAAGSRVAHRVAGTAFHSPPERLDATLLRLQPPIGDMAPCPLATRLPAVGEGEEQRVYVIGHPEGRELAFSLQDNRLLDHEGPPHGVPSLPGRVLLHYRAPTEPGSSGSPVFEQGNWTVVGVHHAGGDFLRRLNGAPGTYAANEGVWIQSIAAAVRSGPA
jgi:hypothetical protein